ncbi:MAG: hypothetical protein O3B42_05290 [Actinomycetota bacterium]|nr:hypothetical protein [Actinomycetota bacterium]
MKRNVLAVQSVKVLALFGMLLLITTGCTTVGNTPATVPPTSNTVTSTVFTPGTVVSTTAVEPATSTTIDRLTEIAAIFEDLERRRLQAIFDQDEEAFRAVHANDEYLSESMVLLGLDQVINPSAVSVSVLEILSDTSDCIAVVAEFDLTASVIGGDASSTEHVIESMDQGWGFSWSGEGWRCDGTHPLSP